MILLDYSPVCCGVILVDGILEPLSFQRDSILSSVTFLLLSAQVAVVFYVAVYIIYHLWSDFRGDVRIAMIDNEIHSVNLMRVFRQLTTFE